MKNRYEIRGDKVAIFIYTPKYGHMETIISLEKLDKAMEFPNSWSVQYQPIGRCFYVRGKKRENGNTGTTYLLHRWLKDEPAGMDVDHINHDTLDNTDENLRVCTHAKNILNRRGSTKTNFSGSQGVSWFSKSGKWRARVCISQKEHYLGLYDSKEEAESAVNSYRNQLEEVI